MLKLGLYIAISSYLILAGHRVASEEDYLDLYDYDEMEENLYRLKESEGTSAENDTDDLHIRRRAFIWFAMPKDGVQLANETECGNSADDFPDFFTLPQMKQGAVIVPIVICIYCFSLIAIVCDKYFIPCVEQICEQLKLSKDVAAATFMAIATSAPELFVNVIGTFVTSSDIGIGTIVGSSMFNTIGVASIGGLAAPYPIKIAWWPVTRDIIIYIFAVMSLVVVTWDGNVYWYEALLLFCGYFVYFLIMVFNKKLSRAVYSLVDTCRAKTAPVCEDKVVISKTSICRVSSSSKFDEPIKRYVEQRVSDVGNEKVSTDFEVEYNIYRLPKGGRFFKAFFIFSWPIRFVVYYTIPDCRRHPRLFPFTFIMCIVWIGANSYLVSWMITLIGVTFGIPDAVLGLTFLAIGGCLPESFSIAILSMKGEGRMGVSNALGANTMNILLSLGFPWFVRTMTSNAESFISIESGSIEYTIIGLIAVAFTLYVSLLFTKFHLSRASGAITLICYFGFLTLAIVADTVFFKSSCVLVPKSD